MNIHQGNGEVAMSDTEYGAALKLGKKQYQDAFLCQQLYASFAGTV